MTASSNPLMSTADLQALTAQAEMAKAKEELDRMTAQERAQRELHDSFMSQDIHPEIADRVMEIVRRAAEDGRHEVEAMRFPSTFLSDGGRAINSFDKNWPATLEGFAKRGMEWFEANMRPLGYHARAEIVSFPGGMPGDVAIYICW